MRLLAVPVRCAVCFLPSGQSLTLGTRRAGQLGVESGLNAPMAQPVVVLPVCVAKQLTKSPFAITGPRAGLS